MIRHVGWRCVARTVCSRVRLKGEQWPSLRVQSTLANLPGLIPHPGETLNVNWDGEEEDGMQIWHRLTPEIQASFLQPCPDDSIGFTGWLGKDHSELLEDSDFKGTAGIYKLFTDSEAEALIKLAACEGNKFTPSKEETQERYVGRFNTLRTAVKDGRLSACLWQRLSANPGGLATMQHWTNVVGANSSLRLVRTQPPKGNEKPGQHLKHVDSREDNTDFLDASSPTSYSRISVITVQCYLNPEEHDGGEFVVWPARLNLANPLDKKETILYEVAPETNPDLVDVKVRLKNGEGVVFHQDTDQAYHGGAPVAGDKDKIALRFVLDMLKKNVDETDLANFYTQPEYGMGYTNDRTSITINREAADSSRNTINCVLRVRAP